MFSTVESRERPLCRLDRRGLKGESCRAWGLFGSWQLLFALMERPYKVGEFVRLVESDAGGFLSMQSNWICPRRWYFHIYMILMLSQAADCNSAGPFGLGRLRATEARKPGVPLFHNRIPLQYHIQGQYDTAQLVYSYN